MEVHQVSGEDRGDIMLYALSTCVWCKRTKALLNEAGLAYRYIDVDLLSADEKQQVVEQVAQWNPQRSFPTTVINGQTAVVGFKPDRIKEVLGI